jgi:2-keto-3-deoxy-L-rhamnonate aldolase RhmA
MRENRLRQALNEDKATLGTHTMTTSPDVVEMIGQTGLIDYIEFVAEYGPHTSAASPGHLFRSRRGRGGS